MKIKEISYEKHLVIPTGQYSNARVGAIITYTLEEGEHPKHDEANSELDNIIAIQRQNIALETLFTDDVKEAKPTPSYTVQSKTESLGNALADARCPECGSPLVEFDTKNGKAKRCSTNKWNPKTKTSEGCQFIKWPDTSTSNSGGSPATAAQKRVISERWPQEYHDGLTFSEAQEIFKRHPR